MNIRHFIGGKKYRVRIITDFYRIYGHLVPNIKGGAIPDRIQCASYRSSIRNYECPLCVKRKYPRNSYSLVGLIDRDDDLPHVYTVHNNLHVYINRLVANPIWGDIKTYEIEICKDAYSWHGGGYTVTAVVKQLLSARDIEIVNNFDLKELELMSQPFPAECVRTQMRKHKII